MSIYAIIQLGNNQMIVQPGRFYNINYKIPYPLNSKKVLLNRILLLSSDSGVMIGNPWLNNITIKAKILHQDFSKQINVYKMRSKKKTRSKRGHQQLLSRLTIESIFLNGKMILS